MMGPEWLALLPQERTQLLMDLYLNQNRSLYDFVMFLIVTQTTLVMSNGDGKIYCCNDYEGG